MDGGDEDLLRLEQGQGIAHPRHVGHRVQGPHLVEVHVPHGATVGLGLRPGDGVIDGLGLGLHPVGQGEGVDDLPDVAWGGVVVMVVVFSVAMVMSVAVVVMVVVVVMGIMVMFVVVVLLNVEVDMVVMGRLAGDGPGLLLPVHGDRHVGARDAAGGGFLGLHPDAGEAQAVHGVQKALLVFQQLVQGGHEHIPGGPHIALDVKRLHISVPPDLPFG